MQTEPKPYNVSCSGEKERGKGPLGRPFPVRNAPEELLLAGFADHGHIGHIQVTVFLGTGINRFLGYLLLASRRSFTLFLTKKASTRKREETIQRILELRGE